MSQRTTTVALLACLVAAALSACRLPPPNTTVDWVKGYSTLQALARDSSLVAVVRITGSGDCRTRWRPTTTTCCS